MALKKNRFIFEDLDYLERKLKDYRKYLDDPTNQWENLTDRTVKKLTKNGGITDMLAASKEKQMESMIKISREIVEILMTINNLREQDAIQKEELKTRGGVDLPAMMKD